MVIERAKVFKKDLREWNRKPEQEQTWQAFKLHFRNAQQELRTSGDLTVKEGMGKDELINVVTESINAVMLANKENETDKENIESMNAVITKEKEEMKKQVKELKQQITSMQQQVLQPRNMNVPPPHYNHMFNPNYFPTPIYTHYNNNNQQRYNYNNRRRGGNNKYKYVGNGRYCWTHGAGDHWGRQCRNKAEGHVDEADFKNTYSGNMKGVRT